MKPEPLGLASSAAIYGTGAGLLFLATHITIPWLVNDDGVEPIVAWFIAAGAGVFLPLLVIGILLLRLEPRREDPRWLAERRWVVPMSRTDWLATLAGGARTFGPASFSTSS